MFSHQPRSEDYLQIPSPSGDLKDTKGQYFVAESVEYRLRPIRGRAGLMPSMVKQSTSGPLQVPKQHLIPRSIHESSIQGGKAQVAWMLLRVMFCVLRAILPTSVTEDGDACPSERPSELQMGGCQN